MVEVVEVEVAVVEVAEEEEEEEEEEVVVVVVVVEVVVEVVVVVEEVEVTRKAEGQQRQWTCPSSRPRPGFLPSSPGLPSGGRLPPQPAPLSLQALSRGAIRSPSHQLPRPSARRSPSPAQRALQPSV